MPDTQTKHRILDSGFIVFSLAYLLMNIPAGMFGTFKSEIVASLGTSLDELVNLYSIGEYCYAGMLIPASLLIVRFSPGTLAWAAIALEALGLGIRWFAHEPTLFFVGMIVSNAGWALAIPLVGQIARNRLSTRAFVIATTVVFCLGQGLQATGLLVADLLLGEVGWRSVYISNALMLIPATILVWIFVRPSSEFDSGSIRATLRIAWVLAGKPVLWLSALASALVLATVSDFGFIWNLNFQASLGWNPDDAVTLTFIFLIGTIIGGTTAPIVARWIGAYATILIGMSYAILVFGVVLFIGTPGRTHLVWAVPVLLTMGMGFGSCSMILPYFAHFFDSQSSGMFFAVGSMANSTLGGLLAALPIWVEANASTWSTNMGLKAMFPYFYAFIIGLSLYMVLGRLHHLLHRQEKLERLQHTTVDS